MLLSSADRVRLERVAGWFGTRHAPVLEGCLSRTKAWSRLPPAAAAARRVTKTIPIVFATSGDPVKLGLVESLQRPGGNLTGLSTFYPELTAKHLEMLSDMVPGLSRVAILWNPTSEDAGVALQETEGL